MHTCRCVRVYVSSQVWVGVGWAQHGFVSGHPGRWEGGRVSFGPGPLGWGSSAHIWLLRSLAMGHCLVPPGCSSSHGHGHRQQSPLGLAPGPSVSSAHTPADIHFEPLALLWETQELVSIAV